jgi:hypothetical protein
LIATKQVQLSAADAEKVFMSGQYGDICSTGQVIGLHYVGPGAMHATHVVTKELGPKSIYLSNTKENAEKQVELFFRFGDMSMSP